MRTVRSFGARGIVRNYTCASMSFLIPGYCGLLFFATFWASKRFAGLRGTSRVKFESSR